MERRKAPQKQSWAILYADDASIVSGSQVSLSRMTPVVHACEAFGLTVSDKETETMCMSAPYQQADTMRIRAAQQIYAQADNTAYLGTFFNGEADTTSDKNAGPESRGRRTESSAERFTTAAHRLRHSISRSACLKPKCSKSFSGTPQRGRSEWSTTTSHTPPTTDSYYSSSDNSASLLETQFPA